jgi:ubiquinone/menaquinone biosynthesis C-methylase UbiE
MRKDYIAVPQDDLSAREDIDFVEKFWTERWDERELTHVGANITQREEYKIIYPYLKCLSSGMRVLDAGCGIGEWTVFLNKEGILTVGMDISERTISRLRSMFPRYQFVHGDVRKSEFDEASFDACISWGVFEHFENGLGDCIREMHRVLKPKGLLFVSVPFLNWRHILRDSFLKKGWDKTYDNTQNQRFYQWRLTRPELCMELGMRGFRVMRVTPIHKAEGVGRWLDWDFRLFKRGTKSFRIARRAFSYILPSFYVSHMILAVAQKGGLE